MVSKVLEYNEYSPIGRVLVNVPGINKWITYHSYLYANEEHFQKTLSQVMKTNTGLLAVIYINKSPNEHGYRAAMKLVTSEY